MDSGCRNSHVAMGDLEAHSAASASSRKFVTLGMFIIDDFLYLDAAGEPTGKTTPPQVRGFMPCHHLLLRCFGVQIGGGGTYASVGARIWYASLRHQKSPTRLFNAPG